MAENGQSLELCRPRRPAFYPVRGPRRQAKGRRPSARSPGSGTSSIRAALSLSPRPDYEPYGLPMLPRRLGRGAGRDACSGLAAWHARARSPWSPGGRDACRAPGGVSRPQRDPRSAGYAAHLQRGYGCAGASASANPGQHRLRCTAQHTARSAAQGAGRPQRHARYAPRAALVPALPPALRPPAPLPRSNIPILPPLLLPSLRLRPARSSPNPPYPWGTLGMSPQLNSL